MRLFNVMTRGMPLPPGITQEQAEECERRLDTARFVLMRRHRWAKRTLRNLTLRLRPAGTLAVDRWLRLYANPAFVAAITDDELVGVFWHEAHHILRHHPDRLEGSLYPNQTNKGADAEINGDLLRQGIPLPRGVVTPASLGMPDNLTAEEYVRRLGEGEGQDDDYDDEPGGPYDDTDDDYEPDDYDDIPNDDRWPTPTPDADDRWPGEGDQGDEGEDEGSDGADGGAPGDGGMPGSAQGDEQGGEGDDTGKVPGEWDPDADNPFGDMTCGSGSGEWDGFEEDPEPDADEQARLNREQRKQDIDTVDEVESGGGYSTGVSESMYREAKERLGRSDYDWRETIGAEIRTAMEMASDDHEEYTFRKRSRRQGETNDIILPAAFRPIPDLWVIVDASGSMDVPKTEAAMREFHGILDRLAIPGFHGMAWDTDLMEERFVETQDDIDALLHHGGGTKMVAAVNYAIENGAEVVVVLSDTDCTWEGITNPDVPLIIGVINKQGQHVLPRWARIVPVEDSQGRW